jgi:hypothetical protein
MTGRATYPQRILAHAPRVALLPALLQASLLAQKASRLPFNSGGDNPSNDLTGAYLR